MQLRATRSLPVPLAEAWSALNDLALLQWSIPGCESLAPTGADTFDAVMALGLPAGLLATRFTTHLRRADVDAPHGCTMHFEAATLAARGAGEARMRLVADGPEATTLQVDIDVRIEGAVAQFGTALVDVAARRIADEFFDRFVAGLGERHAALST